MDSNLVKEMGNFGIIEAGDYVAAKNKLDADFGSGKYNVINVKTSKRFKVFGKARCEVTYQVPFAQEQKQQEYITRDDIDNVKSNIENLFNTFAKDITNIVAKKELESDEIIVAVEKLLVENGVRIDIAKGILKDILGSLTMGKMFESETDLIYSLKEYLVRLIKTKNGFNFNVGNSKIMLVGPTGVGKTTTIAKIGSRLYDKQKDFGMITIDTYRMAAKQQLEAYGDILGCEVKACSKTEQLQHALLDFMEKDCVLVDTTGQSQKKIVVDEHFKRIVELVDPNHLTLVLSATTKTEDLFDCIEKFSVLGINSLIITKLDETNSLGEVINIAYKYPKLKMVYFTDGQSVPGDIAEARPETIVKSVIMNN